MGSILNKDGESCSACIELTINSVLSELTKLGVIHKTIAEGIMDKYEQHKTISEPMLIKDNYNKYKYCNK